MALDDDDDDLDSYWETFTPPEWDPEKFVRTLAVEYTHNNPFYLGLFVGDEELDCPRQHLVTNPDGSNAERIDFVIQSSEFITITHAGLFTNLEKFGGPLIRVNLSLPITIGHGSVASFLPGSITLQGLPQFEQSFPVF